MKCEYEKNLRLFDKCVDVYIRMLENGLPQDLTKELYGLIIDIRNDLERYRNAEKSFIVRKTCCVPSKEQHSQKRWVTIDGRHVDIGGDGDSGSGGGSSGGSLRDSGSGNIKITDEAIDKVPKADIFGDEEKNKRYQQANKDLLKEAMKHPAGTEVSIIYDENMKPIKGHCYIVGRIGSVEIDDHDKPYHAFHNHPSGETFSPDDLLNITERDKQMSITAIGNNAKLYSFVKTENSKPIEYNAFLMDKMSEKRFGGNRFSYDDIKHFEPKYYPDIFDKTFIEELNSFNKECIKGGEQYGFKYFES